VPYSAHAETLHSIKDFCQDKLIVDVTVPLVPPGLTRVHIPPAGSAALETLGILGKNARIASAFQNISSEHLLGSGPVDCDVLVTGTAKAVREETLKLVRVIGMTGWDAGPLENSIVAESLTSVLLYINKQYGIKHSGIKITGVEK